MASTSGGELHAGYGDLLEDVPVSGPATEGLLEITSRNDLCAFRSRASWLNAAARDVQVPSVQQLLHSGARLSALLRSEV